MRSNVSAHNRSARYQTPNSSLSSSNLACFFDRADSLLVLAKAFATSSSLRFSEIPQGLIAEDLKQDSRMSKIRASIVSSAMSWNTRTGFLCPIYMRSALTSRNTILAAHSMHTIDGLRSQHSPNSPATMMTYLSLYGGLPPRIALDGSD